MLVDSNAMDAEFQRGHAAHMTGDLETAAAAYESVLATDPRHAPALHALGNIMLRRGKIDRAETLIREALTVDAIGTGYSNSLGNVMVARGLYAEAEAAYRAELKVRPDFAVGHNQLGTLTLSLGRLDEAIASFQNALKFAPQFSVAANNLGRALNNARRHAEAAEAFRHALRIDDQYAEAHANLGHVLRVTSDADLARRHFNSALRLDKNLGLAHRGLAQLSLAANDVPAAVASLRDAVRVDPADATAYALLGALYFSEGMFEHANDAYDKAIDLRSNDADLLTDAAAVSRVVGHEDVALDRYKQALALRSTHQEALSGFAMLMADRGDAKSAAARLAASVNSDRAGPELLSTYAAILGRLGRRREGIAMLEKALQKSQPPAVSTRLHYALAALLDGEGSYDLAFFHCRRANDERRSTFDPAAFTGAIDDIIAAFKPDKLVVPPSEWLTPKAVFVVGLPRSGVGVVSRLMQRHPQIEALGTSAKTETSIQSLWRDTDTTWPHAPAGLTVQDSTRVAHQCVTGRLPSPSDSTYFLESTWRNYLYLGVIARLFPGVRVIECTRDARDVARSCYFADFATSKGLPFSYELGHIAVYVNQYRRLMHHWRQMPALNIYRLSYEKLVLDTSAECRRLSEFLELDYTAEAFGLDVDSGAPDGWHLDAKSLRRHRHYRTHLEAFVDALDAPPDD